MKHFLFRKSFIIVCILLLVGAVFIFSGEDRISKPMKIMRSIELQQKVFNWSSWTWFPSIQSAIDGSSPGSWLILDASWFDENVTVYKPLTITGDLTFNHTVDGGSSGHTFTITADGVILKWIKITNDGGYAGIKVESDNNTIRENIIYECYTGIEVESDGNIIYNNEIEDCCNGISVSSRGNVIAGNSITNSSLIGILLYGATENWLYSNMVTGISQMDGMGLLIASDSNGNSIYANTIQDHNRGIFMSNSSGNTIHHNNLLNNYTNGIVNGTCPDNTWNHQYTSVGNYWSDFTGADSDGNGIIDSPYNVPYGGIDNVDQYPLVNQWQAICGNVNGVPSPNPNNIITISDISYLIDYLILEPVGIEEPVPPCSADVNGDGQVNQDDIDYLIQYLFEDGEAPVPNCCSKLILPALYPLPPL